jgi:hypothetical protein
MRRRVVDGTREPGRVPLDPTARAQARRITQAIAKLGFVLPGTLTQRRVRCGRAGCHCHADPPQLHGPYWWWTRKVDTKTITRLLTDDQAADYQPWFANARRARELLGELETLSLGIVEADPRSARRPGGRKPATRPSHEPGDNPRSRPS